MRDSAARSHGKHRRREIWRAFPELHAETATADGFSALQLIVEVLLGPGASLPKDSDQDGEVITFVYEGALVYHDPTGRVGVMKAGEFQCVTSLPGARPAGTNASQTDAAHIFRILLEAPSVLVPRLEQRRFNRSERRGEFCVVASQDARGRSLRLQRDLVLYSALLAPGQHIVHELAPGRCAWLQLVRGQIAVDGRVVSAGGGVGAVEERCLSVTAREETELLLFDDRRTRSAALNPAP